MIIYSVSVNIQKTVETEWLLWMKKTHIPDVLATGYFIRAQISKRLEENQESPGYRIDYFLESEKDYKSYQLNAAAALQKDHSDRFKGKFTASRELFSVIVE